MDRHEENQGLSEALSCMAKHWRLACLIIIACGGMGFSFSHWMMTPKYESKSTLIVNVAQPSQDNISDQVSAAQQLVNTYTAILKCDTVLNQVIKNLNLKTTAPSLAKSITISGINQTQLIVISVKGANPQSAAGIANEITTLAQQYAVDSSSVRIISTAKVPMKPVGPNLLFNTVIAFLGGLIFSLMITFLLEKANHTFADEDDVREGLKYPVLGVIPDMKGRY